MIKQNPEKKAQTAAENQKNISEFILKNEKGRGSFVKALRESFQLTFLRAYSGRSKAAALKAKCIDCSNFQRDEVKNCTAYTCPLWEFRPYK